MELQEKGEKKMKIYRKADYKESRDERCLLSLHLKSFRLQFKGKHSASQEFQCLAVRGKKLFA